MKVDPKDFPMMSVALGIDNMLIQPAGHQPGAQPLERVTVLIYRNPRSIIIDLWVRLW